jgi:hypothetical protein
MEGTKTFKEIYLPAEQLFINQVFKMIQDIIKTEKKIPYLDSNKNGQVQYLEYFIVTEAEISFKRRNGDKKKDKVSAKELKDAIKYSLRTDEELTRPNFSKMYGAALGTSLYSFINLLIDEITKRKIVGNEISHQSFGRGLISKIELQKEFVWFKYGDDLKMLSMDHFILAKEDVQKIKNM